jgi:tetratricopeptide (TPR) repeat protein
MPPLRLEIADYKEGNRWRWVLKDVGGAFLADHAVELDPAEHRYQALFNLPAYLRHYASPDKRDEDERRLLHEVGAWIGQTVLGQSIGEKILTSGAPPITVRVLVPPAAEPLLLLPLDIAHARGKPLALNGVRLVFEVQGEVPPAAAPVGDRLRLLALFSLPPAGSPLNLRRERQMLRTLVRRLTGASGFAVELRVLQYGVTRDSLREALEDAEGWDVIHFSGHGLPGSLVLEKSDGQPDPISSTEVSELLVLTGQRLKLVMLSACLSAAASIQQTLARLGETEAAAQHATPEPPPPADEEPKAAPTVARALSSKLDCAVLAMRYAVEAEFATALAGKVYEGLFMKKQPLPQALQLALGKALGGAGAAAVPAAGALSLATSALFGAKAADLKLVPPKQGMIKIPATSLAYFPDEAKHFVGRVSAMTRASATLAAENDEKSGVLFHGMAGAGKTSCAVELAYHHAEAQRFQAFVCYEAPKAGSDIGLELRNFALAMQQQLPSLEMVHVVDRMDEFRDWLPRLTEVLEHFAVLIVLDNLESLLTEAGQWRDERWGLLMDALLQPGGLSRVVLTSRIRPAGLPASVEVIAVHALPLKEAVLLMRELPNLRRLHDGSKEERDLVRKALRLVQGHPKLIQLAEALAAEPTRLTSQLDRAEVAQAQGQGELEAFFQEGETSFDPDALTRTLHRWTNGIAGALPEAARTCFHFVCTVEEEDRESWVLEANWEAVRRRLGRPEPVPTLAEALAPLVAAGLVEKNTSEPDGQKFTVRIHPAVAEAGRTEAGSEFQAAVDQQLAATWFTMMSYARDAYGKSPGAGPLTVRAGLSAFPYLSRLQEWKTAATMLEEANKVDSGPATVAALLPRMRRIVEATTGTEREPPDRGLLAKLLWHAGRRDEAEELMRSVLMQAADRGQFALASSMAGALANLLSRSGQAAKALKVVEQKAEYSRRAGLGPWTQLADEGRRLQILEELGLSEEVLRRVLELRKEMKALPDPPGPNEYVTTWNVRETLWDIGASAAQALGKWEQALDFLEEALKSITRRNAPLLEEAQVRFNAWAPLTELGRYNEAYNNEAYKLLVDCRAVFENEKDVVGVGKVMSALANLEHHFGRLAEALHFEKAALRLKYITGDPKDVAISHLSLASYITNSQGASHELAHRLAAILFSVLTQSGDTASRLQALAHDLQQAGPTGHAALPANFDALCATVEQVEGVRFRELVERLAAGRISGDELLQNVLAQIPELES